MTARQRFDTRMNRTNNPLTALFAAPGVGKSFALTEIASLGLNREALDKIIQENQLSISNDQKEAILDSVGLTVTFNSGFSLLDVETSDNWDEFLGWRILFS